MSILTSRFETCKVFSLPADRMPAHGKIFWFIRALDEDGRGRATFNVKEAAKYFDVVVPTIYRWLKQCQESEYFLYYTLDGEGNATVLYSTYKKLLSLLNLETLGQVVYCDRTQMRNLKPTVTIANLQKKQRQSIHQAKKANKKRIGRNDHDWKVLPETTRLILEIEGEVREKWRGPDAIFDKVKQTAREEKRKERSKTPILKKKPTVVNSDEPSEKKARNFKRRKKVILHVGKRFAIATDSFVSFGATQLGVATDMNRAISTIARRTKSIDRRQLIRILPIGPDEARHLLKEKSCDRKIVVYDEVVYQYLPNIYNFGSRYETSSAYSHTKKALGYTRSKRLKSRVSEACGLSD
jgi:hypothetical protein